MAYVLQGKSGVVRFNDRGTITDEGKQYSGKLTSYPIEEGSKISDHFERDPAGGSIKGVLIGGGAAVATLESMIQNGDILTYTGSYRMEKIVLTSLDFSTNSSIKDGFYFTAGYQCVDIVSARYAPAGDSSMSDQDRGKSDTTALNGKPEAGGLQTTVIEAVSSGSYADYVNSFNNKPAPEPGPSSRSMPSYSGYEGG